MTSSTPDAGDSPVDGDGTGDRAAIVDVLARYARALDDRDFDAVARCFTVDARATFDGVVLPRGRAAIVEHVRGLASMSASTHLLGLPVIDLDGRIAEVETTAIAVLVATPTGPIRTRGLRYRDVFVRDGTWLIAERVHRVDWMYESDALPPSLRLK